MTEQQTERPKGAPMVDFPIIARVVDIAGDDWIVGSAVPAKFSIAPTKIVWMFYTDDPFDGIEVYARIDPKAAVDAKDKDNAFRFVLRQEHVRVVGEIMKIALWRDIVNEIIEEILADDDEDEDEDDEEDGDEGGGDPSATPPSVVVVAPTASHAPVAAAQPPSAVHSPPQPITPPEASQTLATE